MNKKAPADRKSVRFFIRVTPHNATLLKRAAKLEGVRLSEFLRRLVEIREGVLPANPAEFYFKEPPPKRKEQRIELAEKR